MHRSVMRKLIMFTAAMILGPLVAFFLMQSIFSNPLVSGGTAAVVANVVLIAYVYVAFNEEITVEEQRKQE